MIGPNISIFLLPHYLQTYVFTLPLVFPPLSLTLLHLHYQHTHPLTTEAVVLFDYVKKHDDKISLKMGDVITNVEQVCEPHNLYCSQLPYIEQHNGHSNLTIKMLHVTHHMMCCSVHRVVH